MNDILLFTLAFIFSFLFALGGIGAAIILNPVLISMGIPVAIAKPVGLFSNMISLTGASVDNIQNKRLDFYIGIPIIISSFLFAILGAYESQYIPNKVTLLIFVAFLLFSSGMFIFYTKKDKEVYRKDRPFFYLFLIGSVAGLLSGILGVGGGGVISPLMLLLGFEPKKTTTITAFVVPFSSFAGFMTYWAQGSINWHLLVVVSVASIIGAMLGTKFMHGHLKSSTVKKILGVILFLIALKLGYKLW